MVNIYTAIKQKYNSGFRQLSDATCGPASIILAAMGLGLGLKQESEWRDPRFQPWVPVNDFLSRGMALHELQLTSQLIFANQVEISLRRAYPENFKLFKQDIKNAFQTERAIIIVNYRQDDFIKTTLCEWGNPHYSPVINYDTKRQQILIADVDNYVSEPYWVKISAMFHSMSHVNPAFNMPRGWLVLRKRDEQE
ncbi:MAG: hypothetical protein H0U73_01360 [Tatlockia sp.]|nr:hypothetical protein [Tatlockia sp.]